MLWGFPRDEAFLRKSEEIEKHLAMKAATGQIKHLTVRLICSENRCISRLRIKFLYIRLLISRIDD